MPIVTAAEVVNFSSISASVAGVISSGLIPVVQDRVNQYCYNQFTDDGTDPIDLQGSLIFNATGATMVSPNSWVTPGFAAVDEIYVYNSRRNDGYYTIDSISTVTLTIASTETVVSEVSGRSILVSLVQWPNSIAHAAAQLVKYDFSDRPKRAAGITAQSLGPRSESYGADLGMFGYPLDLLSLLDQYRQVRLM